MFAHMEHCWKHHITHARCQPVFPISAFLLKYKDTVDTWKLLNFTEQYVSKKI
jgi:hypothetical protein